MTRAELLAFHMRCCIEMQGIIARKNADYAGGGNPFKNFELVNDLGICSTAEGILVRMCDKVSRISNLINTDAQVKDESIKDTLLDLANYSLILAAYLESSK